MRVEELGRQIVRCAADAPITLDLVPRCPRCGFVLGTALPASALGEVFEEMRRALKTKLAALSHDAIARLIRQHDRGHRLDGFLKITQAAHTDALVRVLDDNLARYLGRLLDEVQDEMRQDDARDDAEAVAQDVVERFLRPRRDGCITANGPGGRSSRGPSKMLRARSKLRVSTATDTQDWPRTARSGQLEAGDSGCLRGCPGGNALARPRRGLTLSRSSARKKMLRTTSMNHNSASPRLTPTPYSTVPRNPLTPRASGTCGSCETRACS